MTPVVRWLPVGHIAHGYRRVLLVESNGAIRHVVVLVPMPYEAVYQVRQRARETPPSDPSLWWGLAVIRRLLAEGVLLNPDNPDVADDGFIQLRPLWPEDADLLSIDDFEAAVRQGYYTLTPAGEGSPNGPRCSDGTCHAEDSRDPAGRCGDGVRGRPRCAAVRA